MFSIVDDVVISGCGTTEAEAQRDNKQRLTETLRKSAERNIILHKDKQQTGLTEVIFHGHRITSDGVKADEA